MKKYDYTFKIGDSGTTSLTSAIKVVIYQKSFHKIVFRVSNTNIYTLL